LKWILAFLAVGIAAPASAQTVWALRTGPDLVQAIPLDPVQPVTAWRGLYGNGDDVVWIYATASPQFFPPAIPEVRRMPGLPWTIAAFFPKTWTTSQKTAWFTLWAAAFVPLQSLPDKGWPVIFPAILRP